ncbi:serine-rich coiled-coil domain-containing protein 2-like [Anarrhichthys ocellatus]|uniref:serine-rich coiled-coil domain-containing protein 2-like n=1 Tax=Anarrhichthys ocellatus TaxID=433405 RepID=UPI0012ED8FCB|nr:serine-rich coiled-coil domain-containing protein 2-like [Anarrhichthys ocellatus]
MSAPPLVDPPTMPTMVSRLPKFGSRPKSTAPSNGAQTVTTAVAVAAASAGTRLTNGFYHHPGPAGVNGGLTAPPTSVKQNGFIRVPTAFSMKWRKENETVEDGGADGEKEWRRGKGGNRSGNNIHQFYPQRQPGSPLVSQRDAKKTTTSSAGNLPVKLPVSRGGSLGSKPSQTAFGLNDGMKQTLNGLSGSNRKGGTNGSLRRPHGFARSGGFGPGSGPGSRSGSPLQKKPPASRCYSSDSLGSAAVSVQLSESNRFRSRSLTQVRRQPSPTLAPSSSSISRNPTGRGASSAQTPPKGSLLVKPPAGTSQTPEGGARGGGVKVQGRSGVSIPSLLPTAALKKPLLLSSLGPASKPSGISYKLSRPSLIKQSRPLRVTTDNEHGGEQEANRGPTARRSSVETPSTTETSPESSPEAPEREGLLSQEEVSIVGETLEDMSLSSSSSLDRSDTSQEYMDDFDNLGNGGVAILLLSKNEEDDSGLDQSCARFDEDEVAVGGVAKAAGLCFLDEGVDWSGMTLSGERGGHQLSPVPRRRRSSQPDYHEQVTIRSINTSVTVVYHIITFINMMQHTDHVSLCFCVLQDVLNNLDSCDLDDDDLMLDEDLPEDASLHSDGDGIAHMAQWRMRQLCWGTQDVHTDSESDFQSYKLTEDSGNKRTDVSVDSDLILALCPPRSPGAPGLGLDVEELAEDCSAVRSQLEYLQRLLLQEVDEDTLTTDALSPETSDSSHSSNTQDLLQEVQHLREELRSRDRTIAHLTLQLTVPTATTRCHCQETMTGDRTDGQTQTSETERESATLPPLPFLSPPWQYQRSSPYRLRPKPSIPPHLARKRVENLVLYFSDTARYGTTFLYLPPPPPPPLPLLPPSPLPPSPSSSSSSSLCPPLPLTAASSMNVGLRHSVCSTAGRLQMSLFTYLGNVPPSFLSCFQSQIFHPSSQDDQEPVTLQAPPPADPCSAPSRPQIPADHMTEGGKGPRKEEEGERKERRRASNRSLQHPQPSKLHFFTSQISRPASGPLPRDPESNEVKLKMAAFTSGLSRLPKPKSH